MSHDALLAQPDGGTVAELFEVSTSDDIARMTTSRSKIEFQGREFIPAPVSRGEFSADESGRSKVTVSAPPADVLTRYIASHPALPTRMRIWRFFEEAPEDFRLIFSGRVTSVGLSGNVVSAQCEGGSSILKARVPRLIFSAFCQHELFDEGCGLVRQEHRSELTGVAQEGAALTEASGVVAGKAADWFTGGYVEIGNEFRMVTKHESGTLHLQVPFPQSVIGSGRAVYAYPSCDKAPATCRDKFDNLRPTGSKGFLGMPTIPSSNPVIWGFK